MTAYTRDEVLNRAPKTKFYGYIQKPFSEKEVNATIQTVISKHKSRSESI